MYMVDVFDLGVAWTRHVGQLLQRKKYTCDDEHNGKNYIKEGLKENLLKESAMQENYSMWKCKWQ